MEAAVCERARYIVGGDEDRVRTDCGSDRGDEPGLLGGYGAGQTDGRHVSTVADVSIEEDDEGTHKVGALHACGVCPADDRRRAAPTIHYGKQRRRRQTGVALVALLALRPRRPGLVPRDRRLARETAAGRRIDQPQLTVL